MSHFLFFPLWPPFISPRSLVSSRPLPPFPHTTSSSNTLFNTPSFHIRIVILVVIILIMRGEGAAEHRVKESSDLCGDLFDHIDDLLDFPTDGVLSGVGGAGGWEAGCDLLCSDPPLLAGFDSGFSAPGSSLTADEDLAAAGLAVATEDIPELEWLSTFVEDSFSVGSFGLDDEEHCRNGKDSRFRMSSPISVLDSTSSTTYSKKPGAAPLPCPHIVVPGRARSKRPRPATFLPRLPISLVSPTTSSSDETDPIASLPSLLVDSADLIEMDNFVESQPWKGLAKNKKKKQPIVDAADFDVAALPVRKCTHCGIQKTPQWRTGPNGPKTLCNACGVRYKSGRLFPEYRPAASPTFVPTIHSNSHKKVLEMRNKMGHKDTAPVPFFVRKTIHFGEQKQGGEQ